MRRGLERVRGVWRRTPLSVRLVGISTVLLAVGLAIAGTATTTLLQRYLIGQVDEELVSSAKSYASQTAAAYTRDGNLDGVAVGEWVQVDFALEAHILTSEGAIDPSPATTETFGDPVMPDLTFDNVERYLGQPFTIHSSRAGSAWRAVVVPVTSSHSGELIGWVTVARPMGEVQGIVRSAAVALWTSAAAIMIIGAVAGTWAVRRSLRPLREIEDTAATIAAGDLSRRVPSGPESTEVGRLAASLNGMLTQIEAAFDARTASEERMRRFVADASHELRTPLAAIRGYGELYRMGALTEKEQVDDTMRRIEQSATRMGGLVEDLLALARLDADRPGRTDPVDLAVLATDAAHDLRALDPTREVRVGPLVPGADDALPATVVRGDESRLRQVLANLVGNVARHTPTGSPAELLVGRVGDRVVLEVRDHGPGIPPEHAARVFERFYRIDASRTREATGTGGGAGLGMAIVAAIVDTHLGSVRIEPTPGGGTTVRVELPALDDTEQQVD
ncbi:HAMP domain-containing protein [Cellulomonas denverensis]|uniref:histidine kinase n=1 Tax=Cellulomonas denverensis TaxID=264297 RepID=A0A7X6KW23_9CELL|nr:HAMP domain-containing protein [Cellulomonas denverensis]